MMILSREDWGADPKLPRKGHQIGASKRTEVFIHHTVIPDNDATRNEWENLDEVRAKMRILQTIRRKDLGTDVPYNFVAFCMADGELVLGEGRGLSRTGSHTANHNRSAIGIAFQGNFEDYALPVHFDAQLADLGRWLNKLRWEEGFENLGSSHPKGRDVWGHRDIKATLCPGEKLYDKLELIRFLEAHEMSMDKASWKKVQTALQALNPPLYSGRVIDGIPGRNTSLAVTAFERRMDLEPRGVIGTANDPQAGIWPTTRELLFVKGFSS